MPRKKPTKTANLSIRDVFADNVRALRGAQGLSQEDIADKAGLSRRYIGSLERREKSTTLDTLQAVAEALGVEPGQLIAPTAGGEVKAGTGADRTTGVPADPRRIRKALLMLAAAIDKNTDEVAHLRNEIRQLGDAVARRR